MTGGRNDVEEVKARLNLVDVVQSYVRLQRAGREFRALCPFHTERTPSFYVSPEKQAWYCQGCHAGGDIFSFVEMVEHTDFRGALEELARRAGVELARDAELSSADRAQRRLREVALQLNQRAADFYHEILLHHRAGEVGRQFLAQRGVTLEDQERFHLGYAPEGTRRDNLVRFLLRHGSSIPDIVAVGLARSGRSGPVDFLSRRVVIPFRDESGRWVGFGGRCLGPEQPKYLNTKGTVVFDKSRLLFGLNLAREAIARERRAVLMEGYFDVVGAHRAGIGTAVSVSGTALTEIQVRLLRRLADEVVLCFDGDSAGQSAARRAVSLLASAGVGCRLAVFPTGLDPDDLSRTQPSELRRLVQEAPPAYEVMVEQALRNASPQSAGERQEALRRVLPVLAGIPEASIRELYAERVGRRLGLTPQRILADVERRADPTPAAGLEPVADGNSELGAAARLLALLAARPALIPEVRDRYELSRGAFPEADDGELFEYLTSNYPHEPTPGSLPGNLEMRLARLAAVDLPELDPSSDEGRIARAVEDCVRRLRIEVMVKNRLDIQQRLSGPHHHRDGEVTQLVAELERLDQRIRALRSGATVED